MSFEFSIKESDKIKGIWIIKPTVFQDERGTIWTSFLKDKIEKLLPDNLHFKHDKFSESKQNVLRGIHGDNKSWKLVTAVYGEIHQVVVDCRKDSSTYFQWEKFIINKDNQQLILIPPNMGNSYYVKSRVAIYHYKVAYTGDYIDAKGQFTIPWNDSRIKIDWEISNPLLSVRDRT
jgi:dTDP-4-dehydrorhamnose 3,5-epimerase